MHRKNYYLSPIIFLQLSLLILTVQASCQENSRLKLVFAGDIMGHDTQIASAKAVGKGEYDYSSCFKLLSPYISEADIAIGNLEVTLAGAPYKGYPAFSSPDALAVELKEAGFDILVNANNHALDRKKEGLERTLKVLDSLGIVQTGVFEDLRDRQTRFPLIVEKNGIRLAILNYTYGTNGIKTVPPNIVNYIDSTSLTNDLMKAKTANPDFIIALMHWGLEYQRTENEEQAELATFLLENGTDLIIGSHPHVVQPIREYDSNKLVVYSLGNMISNQRKRYTDGGILVDVTLEKKEKVRIMKYNYLPVWVHKAVTDEGTAFCLIPANIDASAWNTLLLTPEDAESMKTFLNDTRKNLPGIPEKVLNFDPSELNIF
ncbi:CapA family protein [Bacteroidota bacterium]